ncbi:hypothetical protein [Desertivirga arenae]|uniref:hypothetical protein n=1 Tax=Desertivirga arenae TaxID=2810309 RepID=UPI001A957DED|nr:hypothetical protein [Pedobacter sp. SYSU D00823]
MALVLTIPLLIVYCYLLIRWEKLVRWRLDERPSKTIKNIHFVGLSIISGVGLLYGAFDLGLRGLWTTRFVILLTLLTGCFLHFISSTSAVRKFERTYFKAFAFLPVIVGGLFLVPFLGVVLVLSLGGQLIEPANEVYYQDNKLRIQSTFIGVLGPPRIDVFEKHFLFEKHLYRSDFNAFDFKSVQVNYDRDSTRLHFMLEGYESIERKTVSFEP